MRHHDLVMDLEKRIKATNNYHHVKRNWEYTNHNRILGELDVKAKRVNSVRSVYFEIKGNYNET